MRVLVIHNSYSNYGGEDKVFEQEYAALRSELGDDNVKAYRVFSTGVSMRLIGSLFFSGEHYRAVYEIVRREKIDIVHVHNFFPVLTGSIFAAAKDAGAKLVHTLHNYRWWCLNGNFYREKAGICTLCTQKQHRWAAVYHRCYRNSYLQTLAARWAFSWYKKSKVLNKVDAFFALTSFQKMLVLGLGLPEAKVKLKPNWVEYSLPADSRERSGFVFAGRLEPAKGIELLLKTWETLPSDMVLTVVGSGISESGLRDRYQDVKNIVFRGELSPADTLQCISKARYTIHPALSYETFGLTIIESMRAAVPVIGLRIGTRTELIKDGVNGFLGDPDTLREIILKANSEPNYEILCENARQTADQYRQKTIMKQQLNYYQMLITESEPI